MKRSIAYICATIFLLATLVSLWFLLNNFAPLSPALYSGAILALISIILCFILFAPKTTSRIKGVIQKALHMRYTKVIIVVILTLLGIVCRLLFYAKLSYVPVSDPAVFYETAQSIAAGRSQTGNSYLASFPFLAAYLNILSVVMRIIHDPWLATIALNTAFDIAAAFIVYILVRKLTHTTSRLPLLAFSLWILSPFNILYSTLSLPIIVVNFFIILTILLVHLLVRKLDTQSFWAIAILLGVVLGIGNCFRPIFPVAIVALFLLMLYIIFAKREYAQKWHVVLSFFIVVVSFLGVQKLNMHMVSAQIEMPVTSSGGWNVYVGSNSKYDGTWNMEDQEDRKIICHNLATADECHKKLQAAAIERYKDHGILGSLGLFVRKLYRLSSEQVHIYNADHSLTDYENSKLAKLIHNYTVLYMVVIFSLTAKYLYCCALRIRSTYNIINPSILYSSLLLLGLFTSIILVETSFRYAQVLYPLFILFATLSFVNYPDKQRR